MGWRWRSNHGWAIRLGWLAVVGLALAGYALGSAVASEPADECGAYGVLMLDPGGEFWFPTPEEAVALQLEVAGNNDGELADAAHRHGISKEQLLVAASALPGSDLSKSTEVAGIALESLESGDYLFGADGDPFALMHVSTTDDRNIAESGHAFAVTRIVSCS